MSRTITEISEDISATNKVLHQEIEAVSYGQRPAVQISMTQAAERLPRLLEEIKDAVIPGRLVGLFATGDETALVKVAEFLKANEGIVLDASQMYRTIVDLVEPSYSRDRTFCSTQYHLMIQKVTEIGQNLGYQEIEAPKFKEAICPTTASTMAHIKRMLRDCKVGDQANTDLLTNTVVDAIVKGEIDSTQIPVMVIGVSSVEERNAIARLFNRSIDHTFPKGFDPTVKNITMLFKQQENGTQETE
jgi:hypothetical protein